MCKEASSTAHVRNRHLIHIHIALVTPTYLCMHPAISVSAACTARSGLDCDIVFLTDDAQRSEGNQTSYHWRWPERSLLCCEAVFELLNTILDAVVGPDTYRGQHPSEIYIYIGNRQNTWSKTGCLLDNMVQAHALVVAAEDARQDKDVHYIQVVARVVECTQYRSDVAQG